jgi:hypothetical protein
MRRTASPSRPYGRYAVVLRPSLDPDAYIDAPSQDQEAPKQPKANAAVVLTGPAPSGMTYVNMWSCRESNPSVLGAYTQVSGGFRQAKVLESARSDLGNAERC